MKKKNFYSTPYIPFVQNQNNTIKHDPKDLVDLSSQVTLDRSKYYKTLETQKAFRSLILSQASPSLEESKDCFHNFFTLSDRLLEHFSKTQTKFDQTGFLFSRLWHTRLYQYSFTSSYNVSGFTIEDINFNNPQFFKTERVKLTLVFENKEYISINAFTFLPIGNLLDFVVKHPIWTNKYSFTIRDPSFPITLYYFNLRIKYLMDNQILKEGSIIDIQEDPNFSIWSNLF